MRENKWVGEALSKESSRNNKVQKGANGNNQPKGGGPQGAPNQQQQQQQLQQQLQQMKALQDMKMPQFKGLSGPVPLNKDPNQKAVRFTLPEDNDLSDDEFDEYDDDDDYDDDELDDEMADQIMSKLKPAMGDGGVQ